MKDYEFTLKYNLPDPKVEPDQYMNALFEAGCDDAIVGVGRKGRIGLTFTRNAKSAADAFTSALESVKKAIPGAVLVEATPDLVGVTEIAGFLGCTRQNIQKMISSAADAFVTPVHDGAVMVFHLSEVLVNLKRTHSYDIDESVLEISEVAMQVNLARQQRSADKSMAGRLIELI